MGVAVVAAGLPAIDEVPGDFPAVVLWHFRVVATAMQAIMWATLGLGFGAVVERSLSARPALELGLRTGP